MSSNDRYNDIKDPKYLLKRLRDSGYLADIVFGKLDAEGREANIAEAIAKAFEKGKQFTAEDIFKALVQYRVDFSKALARTPEYGIADSRVFTILIDGGGTSIWLTMYKNHDELGSDWFELYDGNQYAKPWRVKISTESLEVLLIKLNDMGVVNKVASYPKVILDRKNKKEDGE